MSRMNRDEITRLASSLLAEYGVKAPPVPVEQIAVAHGIQVIRSAAEWSESGFLLRDKERTIIGINSRNSPKRQRFTIAHELGHWRLHEGQPLIVDQSVMINKRDDISSQATDLQEIQANQFAADLLIPQPFMIAALSQLIRSEIRSRDELIATLARTFNVSNDAANWRLVNLGVLSS
jgi:Zn-dependent peptidase ImmA (M78 family)